MDTPALAHPWPGADPIFSPAQIRASLDQRPFAVFDLSEVDGTHLSAIGLRGLDTKTTPNVTPLEPVHPLVAVFAIDRDVHETEHELFYSLTVADAALRGKRTPSALILPAILLMLLADIDRMIRRDIEAERDRQIVVSVASATGPTCRALGNAIRDKVAPSARMIYPNTILTPSPIAVPKTR